MSEFKLDTKKLANLVECAILWSQDRYPKDWSEKALFVSIYNFCPEIFLPKENCTCSDKEECDQCPTEKEISDSIEKMRREVNERT